MTEDDTFIALQKASFQEMMALWCEAVNSKPGEFYYHNGAGDMKHDMVYLFFNKHGWTLPEYRAEYDRAVRNRQYV